MGFLYGSLNIAAFTMQAEWNEQIFTGGGNINTPHGIYNGMHVLSDASTLPVVATIIIDDECYSETYAINDTITGDIASLDAVNGGGEYPRAAAYLSQYGIYADRNDRGVNVRINAY